MDEIKPPKDFDWQYWINRWDRMQERYLVRRAERFALIVRLIRETQENISRVLNLGCGPGSLMVPVLEAFSNSEVVGIDFDPTILLLAKARLSKFGKRAKIILADLRDKSWFRNVPKTIDAVISATALHWLMPDELETLYHQIAKILNPNGIFLNADHVGSDFPPIQKAWEKHRQEMRNQEGQGNADDWDSFWKAYAKALGINIDEVHQSSINKWAGGVEEGLPLAWHFDKLRESGFSSVDCFWRCDCDAIYGGIYVKDNNK